MSDNDIETLEERIKALKDKIDKRGTAFLQGQINTLKTELALRSETTNQRITTYRICLYLILILFPIIGFFIGKDFINKTVSTSIEKSIVEKAQPAIDEYKKDLDVEIETMENKIKSDYWYKVGEIEFENKDYARAVKSFTRVIKQQPNHVYAVGVRGIAYAKLGMMKEAINDLDKAISIERDYTLASHSKGTSHFYPFFILNEQAETFKAFNKAADLFIKKGDYKNASKSISVMKSAIGQVELYKKLNDEMIKHIKVDMEQFEKQLEDAKKKEKVQQNEN